MRSRFAIVGFSVFAGRPRRSRSGLHPQRPGARASLQPHAHRRPALRDRLRLLLRRAHQSAPAVGDRRAARLVL